MGSNKAERVYRLMQTVVRRIREDGEIAKKSGRAATSKPSAK
jgi:hypothetical protein